MSAYHPAWYDFKPGDPVDGHAFVESTNQFFDRLKAISDLIILAGENKNGALLDNTLTATGAMLESLAKEGDHLIELWWQTEVRKREAERRENSPPEKTRLEQLIGEREVAERALTSLNAEIEAAEAAGGES